MFLLLMMLSFSLKKCSKWFSTLPVSGFLQFWHSPVVSRIGDFSGEVGFDFFGEIGDGCCFLFRIGLQLTFSKSAASKIFDCFK